MIDDLCEWQFIVTIVFIRHILHVKGAIENDMFTVINKYCKNPYSLVNLFAHRYENKYVKFFKSKPDLPPGMSPDDAALTKQQQQQQQQGDTDSEAGGMSKAAKRNMKRREKRKQQQQLEPGEEEVDEVTEATEKLQIATETSSAEMVATEKAKKIKNLKKKLRQIEELQQKVDSGEIKNVSQEQKDKLSRAEALRKELQQLGDS